MNISYLCSYNERNPDVLHHLRLQMVLTAQQTSNKAAARTHQVDVKTVRLWRRRYEEDPHARLVDRRPETTNHPQRLPPGIQLHLKNTVEKRIRMDQRVYATQLCQHDRLLAPYSAKTLIKHLRRMGLYKTRKKKPARFKDLRNVSDAMSFGDCIQVDIKYLTDIPELKWSLKCANLPRYQITARDRATGATWICYARQKSTTATALFIEYLLEHLWNHGVDTSNFCVQTDNGPEFTVWYLSSKKTLFEQTLTRFGIAHRCIPAGQCQYNSTVESFHNSIEILHYSNVQRPQYRQFFAETEAFQQAYNERHNAYRGYSPRTAFEKRHPDIDLGVLTLKPIELDRLITRERCNRWRSWQEWEDSA